MELWNFNGTYWVKLIENGKSCTENEWLGGSKCLEIKLMKW